MPFGLSAAGLLTAIIVLLAVEMLALILFRATTLRGMPIVETIAFQGAGLAMLVALRSVATGGHPALFGAAMLASLALHLWHVAQRWQR